MIERSEVKLIMAQSFVADEQAYKSKSVLMDQWMWFSLLYDITKTGTPPALSYIQIHTYVRDDDGNEYELTDQNFGAVIEEVTFIPVSRALVGRCVGKELSFMVEAEGALSTSNYYTVTLRVQFYREKVP